MYNDLYFRNIHSNHLSKMENPIGQQMSENDFIQLLTEKANMLKKHLKDIQSSLIMCANIGWNRAIFKLYNTWEEDSLKLQCTITNLGNLEEQLYQLWMQLNPLIQEHCPHCLTM